jgi:hypothetical protein
MDAASACCKYGFNITNIETMLELNCIRKAFKGFLPVKFLKFFVSKCKKNFRERLLLDIRSWQRGRVRMVPVG